MVGCVMQLYASNTIGRSLTLSEEMQHIDRCKAAAKLQIDWDTTMKIVEHQRSNFAQDVTNNETMREFLKSKVRVLVICVVREPYDEKIMGQCVQTYMNTVAA